LRLVRGPGRVRVLEVDGEDHLPAGVPHDGGEMLQLVWGDRATGRPGRRGLAGGGPEGGVAGVAADADHADVAERPRVAAEVRARVVVLRDRGRPEGEADGACRSVASCGYVAFHTANLG